MAEVVTGVEGISNLVQRELRDAGLPVDPNIVSLYVNKAKVESNLGALNDGSGNGRVFGTWQMDTRNITGWGAGSEGIIATMARGGYDDSIIPTSAQQIMAQRFNEILQENGGDVEATLKNQEACFIASYALQAENEQQLLNRGVDVAGILRENPELTFPARYFIHQLPPQDSAKIVEAMAENPNANIRDILPGDIISSNPATYEDRNGTPLTTVAEVVANLNERYNVAHNVAPAAAAGLTAPSSQSVSAIISDLEANGMAETATGLRAIEEEYKAQNGTLPQDRADAIATQLNTLQENINRLYEANQIPVTPVSQMLAQHLGPFSSGVLVLANETDKLTEATAQINGQPTKINSEALQTYIAEMQAAGVDVSKLTSPNATVGDLRTASQAFYQTQQTQAQNLSAASARGENTPELDFFQQITDSMGQQGGLLGMIFGLVSMVMGMNEEEPAPAPAQQTQQTPPTPIQFDVSDASSVSTPLATPAPATAAPTTQRTLAG
jgi:hypothetical protein